MVLYVRRLHDQALQCDITSVDRLRLEDALLTGNRAPRPGGQADCSSAGQQDKGGKPLHMQIVFRTP